MQPVRLRCEYRENPLGITEPRPRLSWQIQAEGRGHRQGAYQILVASSPARLAVDRGDLWDSGRVESDRTLHLAYEGKALQSNQPCWWKVRIWNEKGIESPWSEPAFWMMGLLDSAEWQAQWIGFDRPVAEPIDLEDCAWCRPKDEPVPAPQFDPISATTVLPADVMHREDHRFVRFKFRIPPKDFKQLRRAHLLFQAEREVVVYLNGEFFGRGLSFDMPQLYDMSMMIDKGANLLAIHYYNNDNSPMAGLRGKLILEFEEGRIETIPINNRWKGTRRMVPDWWTKDFDDRNWPKLTKVGTPPVPKSPETASGIKSPQRRVTPFLRRTFAVDKPVKRAWIHATALGIYELHLNGKRVGEDYFAPGYTDYHKRVNYQTYDVTDLVKRGDNAWGAILAPGWYSGHMSWQYDHYYGLRPRLRAQLHIQYRDGEQVVIPTDQAWRASEGPIGEADLHMGEHYDARREQRKWAFPSFDAGDWQPVEIDNAVKAGELHAHPGVPVRATMELKPVGWHQPDPEGHPDRWIADFGQNFPGVVRLCIKARKGTRLVLRHGEALNPDNSLYIANLRRARATDVYICRGGTREETWQPRFTFHGFRYVEINGLPGEPDNSMITGVVLHSDIELGGDYECSDKRVNQLVHNARWSLRGNFLEVPTDCPQRDERLGWTGDAQVFMPTACYLADVSAFFNKWFEDMASVQRDDGAMPDVIPPLECIEWGHAAWSDATVICNYYHWRFYGDRRHIEHMWPVMQRFMDYLKMRAGEDLIRPDCIYRDWLSHNAVTSAELIATAFFGWMSGMMAEMAQAIGREQEAAAWSDLKEKVSEAFRKRFLMENGHLSDDTQTAYVLALRFGLLSGESREKAARRLIEKIHERDGQLSTGFVGANHLNPTLSLIDRDDIAYNLLFETRCPSWLFAVTHGATTIWERWDGWTPERGFQDPSMNSFNHYAYGAIVEWLFAESAGIQSLDHAFRRILIRPRITTRLDFARAHVDTIRGRVGCQWQRDGNRLRLTVTVPPNTSATVYVPTGDESKVRLDGLEASKSEATEAMGMQGHTAVYVVDSGEYQFEVSDFDAATLL